MVSIVEQAAARRSRRIAERRRGEIPEQLQMQEGNDQRNEVPIGPQREPEQNNVIDYDRVKRRIEDEERVNLIRQNDDLREENMRLQEQRSRSTTRTGSISRKSRSSSRQSKSNRKDNREVQRLNNIDENQQALQNKGVRRYAERRFVDDRYEYPRQGNRTRARLRNNRQESPGERHGTQYDQESEENYPEQGIMILQGREMLRNQYEQEEEADRARADRERRRRRREDVEEREIQEDMRQNNRDNRIIQAILKRPMHQDLDQTMSENILREMAEIREMMMARKYDGRRNLDEAIEEAGQTPRQKQLAIIPTKCCLPVFTNILDESTCAIQHIRAYSRSLLQWEENDAVLCKLEHI
ncbi:apical junction molecule-like [Papaver somniferum]|uniref:apical junction molecule-like n=1 Tax=Papaver somniferum TaxID=3469 RepID=UPI000E7035EA|nr:apical junction molecule-like [Papaver somniferum]